MSNREIAINLIQKLPDDVSLHDIAREIEFVAGICEGFEQHKRGEGVSAAKVREMLPSWIKAPGETLDQLAAEIWDEDDRRAPPTHPAQ